MYRLPLTCHVPATMTLPTPHQLAALGPVLCAYRGRLLDGWRAAVGATHGVCVDADGVREYVLLHDAGGRVCWRLYLLPDSDFLAWESLTATLPAAERGDVGYRGGLRARLWRQLADNVMGAPQHSLVLRLAARHIGFLSAPPLTVHLAGVSATGLVMAQRLARRIGARYGEPAMASPSRRAPSTAGPHRRLRTLPT